MKNIKKKGGEEEVTTDFSKILSDLETEELITQDKVAAITEILNDKRREKIIAILNKLNKSPKDENLVKELASLV